MMSFLKLRLAAVAVTLLIVLYPAAGHAQTPAAPISRFDPVVAQLDHVSIATTGKGPAIFLIPGLASPRAVWDGVVPDLAKTHRVYLVQVNGFGGDDPRGNLTPGILDGIVADIAGFIRREKIQDAAVAGHSMGGLVAMMLATRHPDQVGRALVVDSLPFFSLLFGPDTTVAAITPRADIMRSMTLAAPAQPQVTSDPGGIWSNTAAGRIQVANWSAKADKRVVAQALYEVATTDIRPELANVTRPVTVLYATGAGPQAKAIWDKAYAGSPATLVPIADSWHFIMLDQPAAFAAALNAFAMGR